MYVKLKLQCERFEKKDCFALVVLNWLPRKLGNWETSGIGKNVCVFIKACSQDTTSIMRLFNTIMVKLKK